MKLKEYIKIANRNDVILINEGYKLVHDFNNQYQNCSVGNPFSISFIWAERDGNTGLWKRGICSAGQKNEKNGEEELTIIFSNKLITNKKSMANTIVSLIKELTRTEPNKTFVKVGFMDSCENITEDGKEALIYLIWKEKEEELKKLADKISNETEK